MRILDNISYKKKVRWIYIGVPLLLAVLYFTNFKQTLNIWSSNRTLSTQIQTVQESSQQLVNLRQEVERLDNLISFTEAMDYKDDLIIGLEEYCSSNNVQIIQLPETREFAKSGYKIAANQIQLKGGYIDLVKVINKLNQNFQKSRIASVRFETLEDRRGRKKAVIATLHLFNISKENL